MDYDVLILGGGIIGCAVAYELSKYNINIALIERDYDIADDISFVNTAVIYDGSETSNELMSELEYKGMQLIKDHCKKFDVPYNEVGALRISSNKLGNEKLELMYKRARERGRSGVHIIDSNSLYNIEPNLKTKVDKALYCENMAVISPYNLAISYAEVAADNGVNFRLEEEVIDIDNISKGFRVTTNKNKFTCKFVINTIHNEIINDNEKVVSEVINNKMNYILFNENSNNFINSIIINDISKDSFVINVPTQSKGNLIGIKGDNSLTLDQGLSLSRSILHNVDNEGLVNIYTEPYTEDSMFIDDSKLNDGYIGIIGSHYGKITIAPAIAMKIENTLKKNMNMTKKKDYIDRKREVYVFRNMSKEQYNKIIALDNRYGKIVCSCNNISEGEIVDCIRRPLGARTVEGVKRRTGVGMGNCNGSYCNMKIIKILAREMNKNPLSIVDDSIESKVLMSKIKEFNEI